MRWSSHIANGCVPADAIVRLRRAAFSRTSERRLRSWAPASCVFLHGSVAISRTDSMSSGLISPSPGCSSSSSASMAFVSSSDSASRIMSSSSIPMVKLGPVNLCSMTAPPYPGVDWTAHQIRRTGRLLSMALGYDGKLYIRAVDHRGSFQKKMFGIEGDPTPEQTQTIADAKHLIYEGMVKAVEEGAEGSVTGVLVDEQFGGDIPGQAKAAGLKLAMPVEK